MAKAKTINLLLSDGTLDGLVTVEDSSWEGILLIAPREKTNELFIQEETKFWGTYILVSENEVYIGQASELQKRIRQHDAKFDFWDKVILITTKDDSLNKSAIDYIEHDLIHKAKQNEYLHMENKQSGNKPKVNRFEKVKLDNFIDNALLLLELIGVSVFAESNKMLRSYPPVVSINESPQNYGEKTKLSLPDEKLKIGEYVRAMMNQLVDIGYRFTENQVANLTSKEWCHENLSMHYPLFKVKTGDSNERYDTKGRLRYYKDVYVFGDLEVYLTKELFDRGNVRANLRKWYSSL